MKKVMIGRRDANKKLLLFVPEVRPKRDHGLRCKESLLGRVVLILCCRNAEKYAGAS